MRIEAVLGYYEDFGNVRYGTATLGLSIRWPAGAGIALINPISLLLLAAEINGPSSTGGTTSPPPSQTVSRPANEYSSGDSATRGCPEPPQDPRPRGTVPSAYDGYLCRAASDTSDDEVQARSHEHAMAACHEMTGEACTCRRSDDAPTSPP